MAGEKTIATLVGRLRFDADYRPLVTFEKKLDAVAAKMASLKTAASKKISAKVGLDTKGLASKVKLAEQTRITFRNVGIDEAVFTRIQSGLSALSRTEICLKNVKFDKELMPLLKAKLAKLGSTRIQMSHISATPAALAAAESQIEGKLSIARVSIKDVKIDLKALRAQKMLMRNLLESTTIDLPVDVKLRAADKTLREWKKSTAAKVKLYLEADISKQKFYKNVKSSIEYVIGKVGSIKLATPKIKLTVDRPALRLEIAEVLKQIEREAKIKIKLTGDVSGAPRGGSGGSSGLRGHALTGGVAGAAMAGGRGFIPGLGGAFAVAQLNQINQELQSQRMAMASVAGSKEEGAVQQKWVKDLSNEIGMDYRAVTPAYTKMLASGKTSGMSTEEVQGIFQGVSEYGRVMGLDSESMKGSMKAIEQMINKGQVMSEELKGQLAERMPGVVSAMAEAAGFGSDDDAVAKLFKAMEAGTVRSDVLEDFADILARRVEDTLEEAKKSTAAEQQRFLGQFADSVLAFSEGGFDRALAQFFRLSAASMKDADPLVRALGGAFEILMKPLNAIINLMGRFGDRIGGFADKLGMTDDGLVAFGLTVLANLTPLGRMITLFSGLVLAIEDFLVYLDGGESQFGKWFEALSPERQTQLIAFGEAISDLAVSLGEVVGLAFDGWSQIFAYFEESGAGWGVLGLITSLAQGINNLVDAMQRLAAGGDILPEISKLSTDGSLWNIAAGNTDPRGDNWLGRLSAQAAGRPAPVSKTPQDIMRDRQKATKGVLTTQYVQQISKLEIIIPNAANPEQTAELVRKHLNDMLKTAKTNLVEAPQ